MKSIVERAICFPYMTSSTTFIMGLTLFLRVGVRSVPALSAKVLHLIRFPRDGCVIGFKTIMGNPMCMPRVKEHSKELWVECYESNIFARVIWTREKKNK